MDFVVGAGLRTRGGQKGCLMLPSERTEVFEPKTRTESEPDVDVTVVVFFRGSEQFVFRFSPGREADLISSLIDCAEDTHCALDWDDVLFAARRFCSYPGL